MTDHTEDPRIAAYVADELSPADRAAFEALLATDADLRRQVDETRQVVALLRSGFQREAGPSRVDYHTPPRRVRAFRWTVGIAAGLVVVIGTSAIVVQQRRQARLASNLRQVGQGLLLYSNESRSATPQGWSKSSATDAQRKPAEQPAAPRSEPAIVAGKPPAGTSADRSKLAPDAKDSVALLADDADSDGIADERLFAGEDMKKFKAPAQAQKNLDYNYANRTAAQTGTATSAANSSLSPGFAVKGEIASRSGGGQMPGRSGAPGQQGQAPASADRGATVDFGGFGRVAGVAGNELAVTERERLDSVRAQSQPSNTEAYDRLTDNPFLDVLGNPLSTFSIDVDTASYSNVRRFLTAGQLPPKDSVRIEELLNYFPYDYAPPTESDKPFAANVEVADCPWNNDHRLVRVGIKGKVVQEEQRPATNLVFLIDVSGSMQPANKLPLLKQALRLLVDRLGEKDRVAIAVYAGNSGLVLPSTSCDPGSKHLILDALEKLEAGGSTNGAQGIELAYQTATQSFAPGAVNRVVLCTDGDFNVGVTNQGDLTRLIEDKAKSGVFLSVLGFGMGNLKDSTMEKLADKGNGNYAYIDALNEAKKVLVEQMNGTLVTIAKDVKIQIEFNPAVVGSYRLIGYENRLLAKEDFNDDKKDAGEIGAGHTVTALYEVVPAGKAAPTTLPTVDPLKYQPQGATTWPAGMMKPPGNVRAEMCTLKLRYKAPDDDKSTLMEFPVTDDGKSFAKASPDFKFTSAVAGFGMLLRQSPHKGDATYSAVEEWAQEGLGTDPSGYRHEFLTLVAAAKQASGGR